MMAYRIRGFFILATVVAISSSYLMAQRPLAGVRTPLASVKAEELDCCKPFLSASKDLLECKVNLVAGMISVEVYLPKIELKPGIASSATPAPPEGIVDDWGVYFVLCPTLSVNDLDRIRRFASEKRNTGMSKNDPLIYSADIKTKEHWFRIATSEYQPVKREDITKIRTFIRRFSTLCTTIEGENALKVLEKSILVQIDPDSR